MTDDTGWLTPEVAATAQSGHHAYRRSDDGATADFVARIPPHPRPEFHLAPLGLYLEWLRGYFAAGGAPTHYYDYRYSSRFHVVTGDFTTGGECGAFARAVLVPAGVQHLGGRLGHNNLFFFDGFRTSDPPWVPIYCDEEFLVLQGIVEFVAAEEGRAAAWKADLKRREAEHLAEMHESDLGRHVLAERKRGHL